MDEAHKTTRERNKAAREARRAAREAEERQDKALVLDALRAVLKDPEATTEQRLYAVAVLDNMQYYRFVPCGVYQGSADKVAEFAAALQAIAEGGKA